VDEGVGINPWPPADEQDEIIRDIDLEGWAIDDMLTRLVARFVPTKCEEVPLTVDPDDYPLTEGVSNG